MRKAAIAVLSLIVLSACGTAHARRYFQIRSVAPEEPALPMIERRLAVEPAAADPLYDDIRIVYRVTPFEVKYYPYEFWAEKPGQMVTDAVVEFLGRKKAFAAVARGPVREGADIVLRPRLLVLEEIDNPAAWQARLAMEFEFADAGTGRPLLAWSFDRKAPMASKQIGLFPAACSRILEEELVKAVAELARVLGLK